MAQAQKTPKVETRTVVLSAPKGMPDLRRFSTATAEALVVTVDNHAAFGETLKRVIGSLKLAHGMFTETRQPIIDAEKAHREIEHRYLDGPDDWVKAAKRKVGEFENEQDRLQRERQRKADEVERRRQEKERKKQVEEINRLAAQARTKREKKRIETQATAVADAPVFAPAPPVESTYKPIKGTSRRQTWTGQVDQVGLVLGHLAAGRLPATLITFRQIELNNLAKTHREQLSVLFPGLSATSEKKLAG